MARILLVNPPHPSIGSRIPPRTLGEHLPPLGLLSIGGPLIDDGHDVQLIDFELDNPPPQVMAQRITATGADVLMIGHSGSTSAHPLICDLTRRVRSLNPELRIVYGGVFPTYHHRDILQQVPQIDVIVRGEGEETVRRLMAALEAGSRLDDIPGLAYRREGGPVATPPAPMIAELDSYRVGWELADLMRYSYWGQRRAVVMQFSRGCPHLCTYCGQRGFWSKWRHRDPKAFAAEIGWLYREHGVEVINLADENPTSSRKGWIAFLEAMIAEDVPVTIIGSTRAGDIVRDADILALYHKAGVRRFLLGMETTDAKTLDAIKKGSTVSIDREAIRLLRMNRIISMVGCVFGFEEETDSDYWRALKQIISYDPDHIQAVYVTPHRWTPFFREAVDRDVVQPDIAKWDYKHQVLATRHMAPWRVIAWVKFIEAIAQGRPRALWRLLFAPDREVRDGIRWYYRHGRLVWPYEIWNFLFKDRTRRTGLTVSQFWGAPQDDEENALERARNPAGLSSAKQPHRSGIRARILSPAKTGRQNVELR